MTEREATLDELLSEPIIRKVMASDGVRAADVRQLVQQASARTFRKRSRQWISVANVCERQLCAGGFNRSSPPSSSDTAGSRCL